MRRADPPTGPVPSALPTMRQYWRPAEHAGETDGEIDDREIHLAEVGPTIASPKSSRDRSGREDARIVDPPERGSARVVRRPSAQAEECCSAASSVPLPLPFPCACTENGKRSSSTALAIMTADDRVHPSQVVAVFTALLGPGLTSSRLDVRGRFLSAVLTAVLALVPRSLLNRHAEAVVILAGHLCPELCERNIQILRRVKRREELPLILEPFRGLVQRHACW